MGPEELDRAASFMTTVWDYGPCPVCHDDNWGMFPRLGQISNHDYEGRVVPVLLVGCQTCGHVVPIAAVTAGILEPEADAPEISNDG